MLVTYTLLTVVVYLVDKRYGKTTHRDGDGSTYLKQSGGDQTGKHPGHCNRSGPWILAPPAKRGEKVLCVYKFLSLECDTHTNKRYGKTTHRDGDGSTYLSKESIFGIANAFLRERGGIVGEAVQEPEPLVLRHRSQKGHPAPTAACPPPVSSPPPPPSRPSRHHQVTQFKLVGQQSNQIFYEFLSEESILSYDKPTLDSSTYPSSSAATWQHSLISSRADKEYEYRECDLYIPVPVGPQPWSATTSAPAQAQAPATTSALTPTSQQHPHWPSPASTSTSMSAGYQHNTSLHLGKHYISSFQTLRSSGRRYSDRMPASGNAAAAAAAATAATNAAQIGKGLFAIRHRKYNMEPSENPNIQLGCIYYYLSETSKEHFTNRYPSGKLIVYFAAQSTLRSGRKLCSDRRAASGSLAEDGSQATTRDIEREGGKQHLPYIEGGKQHLPYIEGGNQHRPYIEREGDNRHLPYIEEGNQHLPQREGDNQHPPYIEGVTSTCPI